MLNGWKVVRVLLDSERFLLLLPFEGRAVLNRVKGHNLAINVPISAVDQDVVVDVLDPIEVLQQRHLLINENSSLLLEHCSHQCELAQLRGYFLAEAERTDVIECAAELR